MVSEAQINVRDIPLPAVKYPITDMQRLTRNKNINETLNA